MLFLEKNVGRNKQNMTTYLFSYITISTSQKKIQQILFLRKNHINVFVNNAVVAKLHKEFVLRTLICIKLVETKEEEKS